MGLKPVSVSRLNSYIRRILHSDPILSNVSVIGEISNLKYHSSGHIYFTLKDEASKINCFFSREQRRYLRYELDNGMEITACGQISVYERNGSYSLNVDSVEVSGLGDLQIAFQQLRDKLEREGLFHPQLKKPLPAFPKKVAVITSATGAAVQDIIKIIRGRNRLVDILVCPCLVQGPEAAADIARSICAVNDSFSDVDVIIVGRGGGSMEELWAFNEEIVARAIFLSEIPVISAVGHETDFTIADFVADCRAETPTAAAQMAVPDVNELKGYLKEKRQQLNFHLQRTVQTAHLRLNQWTPQRMKQGLSLRLEKERRRAEVQNQRLKTQMEQLLQKNEKELTRLYHQLEVNNPSLILKRGCGILLDENGASIRSAAQARPGQNIQVRLRDGALYCGVTEVKVMKGGSYESTGKEAEL